MEEGGVYSSQGLGGYDRNEINNSIDQKESQVQYNIQSVLHFIQSEWTRLELQRSQWEMERAELQARIAFLQGERRGQENIKQDLVRRIKMLEHALKHERVRYHQLKSCNAEPNTDENVKPDVMDGTSEYKNILDPGQVLARTTEQALQSNARWRESRLKLKHFLQEVGYTDSVLAVRQSRVRQLLCPTGGDQLESEVVNGMKTSPSGRNPPSIRETEEAVLRTFDFLKNDSKSDDKPINADTSAPWSDEKVGSDSMKSLLTSFESVNGQPKRFGRKAGLDSGLMELMHSLSEREVPDNDAPCQKANENTVWPLSTQSAGQVLDGESSVAFNSVPTSLAPGAAGFDNSLSSYLGDLSNLTVTNESDLNGGDTDQAEGPCFILRDDSQKQSQSAASSAVTSTGARLPWSKKYVLRGHFDAVRSVAFHPSEPCLFSASEDGLVMLWALHRPGSLKSNGTNGKNGGQHLAGGGIGGAELEPVHVYRGHRGPVLSLSVPAIGQCASSVFSSGLDGVVRGWRLPSPDSLSGLIDLYSLSQCINECGPIFKRPGSTGEAVWCIAVHPNQPLLAAVDTATALAFWPLQSDSLTDSPQHPTAPSRTVFLNELVTPSADEPAVGSPTSVTYFSSRPDPSNASQCLVGTNTGWLALIDVETGKLVNKAPPPTSSASNETAGGSADSDTSPLQDTTPFEQTVDKDLNAITAPASGWGPRGIHGITVHQTFSLAVTGHEDRCIRFYDIGRQQGGCVGTTVTHLDAVTCLTVDPHDLYVLTGSHDSSIRLWDLETRTCVQEITCHRVKNNESVHAVAMHPTLPFAASAGADGVCKVYTSQ